MSYKDFLKKMSTSKDDWNMKEGDFKTYNRLKDDL